MDQRVCQWHKWGLGVGEGAPHTLQSYRPWLRTTKFDCRSERLNIQTDNVQTTYCNRTQTHNLCSNQPRDSNRKVCSNRPTTVRTWPLTASFFNLCFLRLRTNGRRPDTLPQPITERAHLQLPQPPIRALLKPSLLFPHVLSHTSAWLAGPTRANDHKL